jgi:adenylylsulfate kinase-like enzyme
MKFAAECYDRFPVVWLTGNTGAGKSTLAFGMRDYFNEKAAPSSSLSRRVVVLDGDEMRETVSVDEGFSPEDRRKHNLRVARLANLLSKHGFLVIVSVIAPFDKVRGELQPICEPVWVYVKRSGLEGQDRPYEAPSDPALTIDNDTLSIAKGKEKFRAFLMALPQRRAEAAPVGRY